MHFKKLFFCHLLLLGCLPKNQSDTKQLFQNSKRESVTENEYKMVVSMDSGCTGFFVKNDDNRIIVSTARHCYDYQVSAACSAGKITFQDSLGNRGTCTEILVANQNHDIFLFEASFPSFNANQNTALSLANYAPPVHMKLKMIGFPADRKSQPTTTSDCWVLLNNLPNFRTNTISYRDTDGTRIYIEKANTRQSLHNCSTYGGNSGGPILYANYKEVIGQPDTYVPGTFLRKKDELGTAAHLGQMESFVKDNMARIQQLKISLANKPGDSVPKQTVSSTSVQEQWVRRYFSPIDPTDYLIYFDSAGSQILKSLSTSSHMCESLAVDIKYINGNLKSERFVAIKLNSGESGYVDRTRLREKGCN